MNMQTKLKSLIATALLAAAGASGQTTTITYQGLLNDSGTPANGQYDLVFVVRDSAANQVGPLLDVAPLAVAAGRFTVTLDFGAGVFTGDPRWLEIGVRTNGSSVPWVTLSPRQPLTATPYAIQSLVASNVIGNINDSQLSPNIARLNANPSFNGLVSFNPLSGPPFFVNNSNKVSLLNADFLDGLDSAAFSRINHTHAGADIASGTLADARLSLNVSLLNRAQTFSAANAFGGPLSATNSANLFGGTFAGNGSGLTNLNAAALFGLIPSGSLPVGIAQLNANQSFTGAVTFNPAAGAPFQVGSSSLVTNLNADLIDGQSSGSFRNTGGNANAGGSSFIGTIDNSSLELRVNGARALLITPNANGANIAAGHPSNVADNNFGAQTVAGGFNNAASNNFRVHRRRLGQSSLWLRLGRCGGR
jgi:hypothetical protein